MSRLRTRYRFMPDGRPHEINDEGRTCTVCFEFKPWNNYRASKGSVTGHTARCICCANKKSLECRHKKQNKVAEETLFLTPVNEWLMRKWSM